MGKAAPEFTSCEALLQVPQQLTYVCVQLHQMEVGRSSQLCAQHYLT